MELMGFDSAVAEGIAASENNTLRPRRFKRLDRYRTATQEKQSRLLPDESGGWEWVEVWHNIIIHQDQRRNSPSEQKRSDQAAKGWRTRMEKVWNREAEDLKAKQIDQAREIWGGVTKHSYNLLMYGGVYTSWPKNRKFKSGYFPSAWGEGDMGKLTEKRFRKAWKYGADFEQEVPV